MAIRFIHTTIISACVSAMSLLATNTAEGAVLSPTTFNGTFTQTQTTVVDQVNLLLPAGQVNAKVDVYILADTTSSMSVHLRAMQDKASEFATQLQTNLGAMGVDLRIGIGSYYDFPDSSSLPAFVHQLSPVDESQNSQVEAEIGNWLAAGGDDGSEGQLFALDRLARDIDPTGGTIGWRSDTQKVIVWFGDAPGHDPVCAAISGLSQDITENSVISALTDGGFQVIAVSAETHASSFYPLGLNDSPTIDAHSYQGICDIGGTPGQADRIVAATDGRYVPDASPENLAQIIEDGITDIVQYHGPIELQETSTLSPFTTNIVDVTPGGCEQLRIDEAHVCNFEVTFTANCEADDFDVQGQIEALESGTKIAHQEVTLDARNACIAGPIALCEPVEVQADAQCQGVASVDDGSYDPDAEPGDVITIVEEPPPPYPLGETQVTLTITDDDGLQDSCEAAVVVVDWRSPVIDPLDLLVIEQCDSTPQLVELPLPTVQDNCSTVELFAQIVGIDGQPARPSINVDVGPGAATVILPAGTYTVNWVAVDTSGNTTQAFQTVEVVATDELSECCDTNGRSVINGTSGADNIDHMLSHIDLAVQSGGADDVVTTGYGNDCIVGGTGADNIASVAGHDIVWGGSEDDNASTCTWNLGGSLFASGGAGNDNLAGQFCEYVELWGGSGNDVLTGSYFGDDQVYPGSGLDVVQTLGGDDEVHLFHICELTPGKALDGGAGNDTLYIPVSLAEVTAAGVTVSGFENIVVDSSRGHLSDCRG